MPTRATTRPAPTTGASRRSTAKTRSSTSAVRGIRVSTNVGALVRAFACAGEISSEAIEGLQSVAIVVFARAADAKKALEIPTRRVGFGTGICEAVSREVLEESKNGLGDGARPRLRLLSASQFRAELEALIRNTLAKVADASATAQAMDEQDEEEVVDDATKKQVPDKQNEEAVVVDAIKKPVPDEQDEEAEAVDYATKKPEPDEQDEKAKAVGDATKKQVPDEQNEEAVLVDATDKPVPDEQDEEAEAVTTRQRSRCRMSKTKSRRRWATRPRSRCRMGKTSWWTRRTSRRTLVCHPAMPTRNGGSERHPASRTRNRDAEELGGGGHEAAASCCILTIKNRCVVSASGGGDGPARPSVPASGSDATWSVPPTGAAGATALRKPQEAKIPGVRDGAVTQQPSETPHSGQPQGTPALTAETQQQLARCFELIRRAVQLLEKCNLQQGRSGSGKIIESV